MLKLDKEVYDKARACASKTLVGNEPEYAFIKGYLHGWDEANAQELAPLFAETVRYRAALNRIAGYDGDDVACSQIAKEALRAPEDTRDEAR